MTTILCALVMLAPLPALAANPALVVVPSTPVAVTTAPTVSPQTVIVARQPPAIPVYSCRPGPTDLLLESRWKSLLVASGKRNDRHFVRFSPHQIATISSTEATWP